MGHISHYPQLSGDVRKRLAQRGIDPERSTEAWLQTILDGSFPLTAEGLPRPRQDPRRRRTMVVPIPMAVVVP